MKKIKDWVLRLATPGMAFALATAAFCIVLFFSFNGYNGTDDIHYAQLAANLLKGEYNPFNPDDIFGGRVLLVGWQAVWFALLGINDWAMILPSTLAVIIMAWLLCFSFQNSSGGFFRVFFISALTYFSMATLGVAAAPMPDVYIALFATVLIVLPGKWKGAFKPAFFGPVMAAFILVAGWLVKETIVYIALIFVLALFWQRKNIQPQTKWVFFISSLIFLLLLLGWYYSGTGDPLYRFTQMRNGAYLNDCRYDLFSPAYFAERLTLKIPGIWVQNGMFPLLMAMPLILVKIIRRQPLGYYGRLFLTSFLLVMFLPVSLAPYLPLCHDYRHAFFMIPLAIVFLTDNFFEGNEQKETYSYNFPGLYFFIWMACVAVMLLLFSYNKWLIFVYGLLAVTGGISFLISWSPNKYLFTSGLLFLLSIAYVTVRPKNQGYAELKKLMVQVRSNSNDEKLFFIDHDTKSHVQLICQFSDEYYFKCLDDGEFRVFKAYNGNENSFSKGPSKGGWLIINPLYTEHPDEDILRIENLAKSNGWRQLTAGVTHAVFLPGPSAIDRVAAIIN